MSTSTTPAAADVSVAIDTSIKKIRSGQSLAVLVGVLLVVAATSYGWMHYTSLDRVTLPISVTPVEIVPPSQGVNPHANDVDQIEAMAEKLASKMKDQPQDSEGWAMLGRTYEVLGHHTLAITAFEKAIALRGDDNVLRADYAAARASAGLPPDSRGVAVAQPANSPASTGVTASHGLTLSGTVSLTPSLMKQAGSNDTVFIFARPSEGSRMPLALLRKQVKDLPVQFTLDDSMAMSPASRLSQATGPVTVVARVSKNGSAIPEKGDLVGQSGPVAVSAKNLAIDIRETIK